MRDNAEMSTVLLIALMFLQQGVVTSVRVTSLEAPQHAVRYTNQTLTCHFDLDSRTLYSIKWYLNDVEFFSYKPQEEPTMEEFYSPNSSVKVIMEGSTGIQVMLHEVDLSASGVYTCEVLGERPDFKGDKAEATMTVVVLPEEQPNIEGDVAGHYSVGDSVNLNCTAAPSIPAATLVWSINDKQAPKDYVQEYEVEKHSDGLFVSRLGLNFKLSQSDFIKGELKLKCTATIETLYRRSDEHSQQDPTAQVVRKGPEEGSLVTPTDPTNGSGSRSDGLTKQLLTLHVIFIFSVHLLR